MSVVWEMWSWLPLRNKTRRSKAWRVRRLMYKNVPSTR